MRKTILLLAMLIGFWGHSQNTLVKENISYTSESSYKQQLDLYLPDNTEDFPTVLFVHGGSLTSGDRKDEPFSEMCGTLTSLGIGCAAMSYRLAPDNKWPAQPNDVASAFSWIKENIAEFKGDNKQIFLFGHSSGCLLVSLVGSDTTYLKKHGYSLKDIAGVIPMGCRLNDELVITETKPSWYEMYSVRPKDTIRFDQTDNFSVYNSLAEKNNAVPAKHVSEDLPPTLILMGEHERYFPPILRDAAEFVGRVLVAGGQADIKILDDRTHRSAINKMTTKTDIAVQTVRDFIMRNSNDH